MYSTRGLHGQVVEEIAQRIMSGSLRPGESFDVDSLGDELGVSRTVLRESVKVLSAKGLLDARPKRGTFVRPESDWNLLDSDVLRWQINGNPHSPALAQLGQVRSIIEPEAAALAAENRSELDLKALTAALASMRSAVGDVEASVDADVQFHRALLKASHNDLLVQMGQVIETGLAVRDRAVHTEVLGDPTPSHLEVLEAVGRQDAVAARTAMNSLLEMSQRDLTLIQIAADTRP